MQRRHTMAERVLSRMPDCDAVLRRVAEMLRLPERCRRRACQTAGSCEGRSGPPCFFEHRTFIADELRDHMSEYRAFWAEERERMHALLRRREEAGGLSGEERP